MNEYNSSAQPVSNEKAALCKWFATELFKINPHKTTAQLYTRRNPAISIVLYCVWHGLRIKILIWRLDTEYRVEAYPAWRVMSVFGRSRQGRQGGFRCNKVHRERQGLIMVWRYKPLIVDM